MALVSFVGGQVTKGELSGDQQVGMATLVAWGVYGMFVMHV